jgi:hypothetical protein
MYLTDDNLLWIKFFAIIFLSVCINSRLKK